MEKIKVQRERSPNGLAAVLWLSGPLSLATIPAVEDELRAVADLNIVIDVSGCPYIDSAGLGTILSQWAHTQRAGTRFALTGITPRINVLLELTKVNTVLPIYRTPADAERAFVAKAATA